MKRQRMMRKKNLSKFNWKTITWELRNKEISDFIWQRGS